MNNRNPVDGLPAKLYQRSPLFYWSRFIEHNGLTATTIDDGYASDFWIQLNRGWYLMKQDGCLED
jgi:hypothetical protein